MLWMPEVFSHEVLKGEKTCSGEGGKRRGVDVVRVPKEAPITNLTGLTPLLIVSPRTRPISRIKGGIEKTKFLFLFLFCCVDTASEQFSTPHWKQKGHVSACNWWNFLYARARARVCVCAYLPVHPCLYVGRTGPHEVSADLTLSDCYSDFSIPQSINNPFSHLSLSGFC